MSSMTPDLQTLIDQAGSAHEQSLSWIEYLGALVNDAEPIMREFAQQNPKHIYEGREQDPRGVHDWLTRFDAISKSKLARGEDGS